MTAPKTPPDGERSEHQYERQLDSRIGAHDACFDRSPVLGVCVAQFMVVPDISIVNVDFPHRSAICTCRRTVSAGVLNA